MKTERFSTILNIILLLSIGGMMGYGVSQLSVPSEESADVGFARDMSDHHEQAVTMAILLYDRTEDEEMRTLAYDILTTQQAQIGMMGGWLDAWGHAWSNSGPKMVWMGMSVEGLMPGMATQDQMDELRDAQGVEADAIFIRLMIPHHLSGVAMASAAATDANKAYVRNLAQNMAESQQGEIEYMQKLLTDKGFDPVPLDMTMPMGDS